MNKGYSKTNNNHRYNNSDDSTLQSLDLSRLKLTVDVDNNSRYYQYNEPKSIPFSPKKYCEIQKKYEFGRTNMPGRKKQQREWRSAIDPKSGRRYYYDVHTRETQWHKPLELASKSERRDIEEKEKKQHEFFKAMEKNILKSMQCGQVPGQVVAQEDTVESLPKPITKKVNKPKLLRTISSMDHDLLKELTNIDAECNPPAETSPDYGLNRLGLENSPENASTDFFRALPQPEDQTIKSSSCIPPSLTPCSTSSFSSFDKDEPVITTGRSEFHDVKALSKSIPKPHLSKRNTCGTMYVSSTMADPDKDATIKVRT